MSSLHKRALKRKVWCAPNTFGSSTSAVVLSDILNQLDNPKLTADVSRFFHCTCKRFKDVSSLQEKELLLKLIKQHCFAGVETKSWPNNVESFLKNCLSIQYNKYLNR